MLGLGVGIRPTTSSPSAGRVRRPPEIASIPAASLARRTGGHSGPSRIALNSLRGTRAGGRGTGWVVAAMLHRRDAPPRRFGASPMGLANLAFLLTARTLAPAMVSECHYASAPACPARVTTVRSENQKNYPERTGRKGRESRGPDQRRPGAGWATPTTRSRSPATGSAPRSCGSRRPLTGTVTTGSSRPRSASRARKAPRPTSATAPTAGQQSTATTPRASSSPPRSSPTCRRTNWCARTAYPA